MKKIATPPARRIGLPRVVGEMPRVLILGSFPGEMSLLRGEYYAHPQNQFWRLMEAVLGIDDSMPYRERVRALKCRRIALWDVIESCRRKGSSDAAITDHIVNDIPGFCSVYPSLRLVVLNGKTAERWLHAALRQNGSEHGLREIPLPSSSPANSRMSFEEKKRMWMQIMEASGDPGMPSQ